MAERKPKLLEQVRLAARSRQYSPRTEEAYIGWIRRFVRFHGMRHPLTMGSAEIASFLTALATRNHVTASTQNQAASALLFLYREVLGIEVEPPCGVVRPRNPRHLPVVMTKAEVTAVLSRLHGDKRLVVGLLYGSGLRLREALLLRVKDLEMERGEGWSGRGKGERTA